MSLKDAYTQLAAVLTADAAMQAWAVEVGGALNVIQGNREVSRIAPQELPALVLEMGNADLTVEVGGQVQGLRHDLRASLVWHEPDEASAFGQRLTVAELVPKVLLAAPTLGDTVDGAWVSAWKSDYGYNHPRQSVGFTVSADLIIDR